MLVVAPLLLAPVASAQSVTIPQLASAPRLADIASSDRPSAVRHMVAIDGLVQRSPVDGGSFRSWWSSGVKDERFQGHGAIPALQRTNIPGYDPTVSDIVFDRDRGRASYVARVSAESLSIRRSTGDTLAAVARQRRAALERPRVAAAVGWRLRPFWL